jgi:hypothetical protein
MEKPMGGRVMAWVMTARQHHTHTFPHATRPRSVYWNMRIIRLLGFVGNILAKLLRGLVIVLSIVV